MTLIDSCVFIAAFRKNELQHKEAQSIIDKNDKLIVLDYVLSEVYTVIMLRESYELASQVLNWIVSHPKCIIERLSNQETEEVVNFLQNTKTKLSFVDAALCIVSRQRNYELITFDEGLLKLYFA